MGRKNQMKPSFFIKNILETGGVAHFTQNRFQYHFWDNVKVYQNIWNLSRIFYYLKIFVSDAIKKLPTLSLSYKSFWHEFFISFGVFLQLEKGEV